MSKLKEIAEAAINAHALRDQQTARESHNTYLERMRELKALFQAYFIPECKLLTEAGVTWSAGANDQRYPYKGHFLQFTYKGKSVKMDFENEKSYRYEYASAGEYANYCYGQWPKDDFVLFIYRNLIEPVDGGPVIDQIATTYEIKGVGISTSIDKLIAAAFPNPLPLNYQSEIVVRVERRFAYDQIKHCRNVID